MSSRSLGEDSAAIASPPPLNSDALRRGLEVLRGSDSVILPIPPRPDTR